VLEAEEGALARGATVLGYITGYGATADARHLTAPEPSGEGATRAIRAALSDAGAEPGEVAYVNAHGTSTPMNDARRPRRSRPPSATRPVRCRCPRSSRPSATCSAPPEPSRPSRRYSRLCMETSELTPRGLRALGEAVELHH